MPGGERDRESKCSQGLRGLALIPVLLQHVQHVAPRERGVVWVSHTEHTSDSVSASPAQLREYALHTKRIRGYVD